MRKPLLYAVFVACLFPAIAWSQSATAETTKAPVPDPQVFRSTHTGVFNGKTLDYEVVAGETRLLNDAGKPTGNMWSTAYLVKPKDPRQPRPVVFIFNGGPGSASVWLHMGLFGPKLVKVASDADADDGAAPYSIADNPDCLLDIADLVFIDPIGTGYSQAVGEGKNEDFWGLEEDAHSIARFMRLWVTQHQRWNAPKYIAGESFGTTRAAALVKALEEDGQNMAINGVILISQALDYTGSTPVDDNIIAYITYLPTMAATAWYHKKAGQGKTLEAFMEEVRAFAYKTYTPALFQGYYLDRTSFDEVANQLSVFLGLPASYIRQSNLRVLPSRFRKELLRDQGLTLGSLDSRYTTTEPDQVSDTPVLGDAASNAITSAYTAALYHYLGTDLKVVMDRPYLTSNSALYPKWKWMQGGEPSYVNVSRRLSHVMRRNTQLKVMVANGYYDMVTPFFDAEFTFSRHGFEKDRIQMAYYEGGHMMYVHDADFRKLTADIRSFLQP
jgi:carboxypeptidase C (cathepsin A)